MTGSTFRVKLPARGFVAWEFENLLNVGFAISLERHGSLTP